MVAFFFFFGVADGVGHCGGCGFFFFCCDRCLKGLWVVVRSGDDFFLMGLLRWVSNQRHGLMGFWCRGCGC